MACGDQGFKKKLIWRTTFGTVQIQEQILRLTRRGERLRPFCTAAHVQPRGYSRPLQRALSDFGAEASFARAAARMREHYGIEVPASAIREITYRHARAIEPIEPARPAAAVKTLVTQIDGTMIPLVESRKSADRRKTKTTSWNEVRLCCARAEGEAGRVYGATLGTLENVSLLWQQTVARAGLNEQTFVHGLGDGAPWIVQQFEDNFGSQGKYLVDFYHVSEYLAGAGLAIAGPKKAAQWLQKQKGRLATGQIKKILRTLEPHREAPGTVDAPVDDALRYLGNRLEHLHYPVALKAGLPIGSGEVESAHRHVIQHRLKLAGAWWKPSNAQAMIGLRVSRANGCWNTYWTKN
jgi:hypothetical protein